MKKIILASKSPRRKILLQSIFNNFIVMEPISDEYLENNMFSYEKIENIAESKALSVLSRETSVSALVISADTVVVYNNCILGKPKDRADAFLMLKTLSGKTHIVVSSVCIIDKETGNKQIASDTTEVEFEELSDNAINNYLDVFKPFDKAGSYGIQELPKGFLKGYKGSFDNVIGLPTELLNEMLMNF